MKNNLFLAVTMALSLSVLPILALDSIKLPEIADKAYTAYIQTCKNVDKSYIDTFKNSSEYKELKTMLEDSLKANNNYKVNRLLNNDIKISEQLLTFGKLLKAKLSDKAQIIKDSAATDSLIIDQVEMATVNNYGYFEALKAYNLHALFLYTLGDLTQEQKDVIEMASKLGNLLNGLIVKELQHQNGIAFHPDLVKLTEEEFVKQHEELKNSPLMQKLRDEELQGTKLNGSWFKAESAVPNLRLFIQALNIAVTYEEEIFRKYNLTEPIATHYSWQIKQYLNFTHVFKGLGFKNF